MYIRQRYQKFNHMKFCLAPCVFTNVTSQASKHHRRKSNQATLPCLNEITETNVNLNHHFVPELNCAVNVQPDDLLLATAVAS